MEDKRSYSIIIKSIEEEEKIPKKVYYSYKYASNSINLWNLSIYFDKKGYSGLILGTDEVILDKKLQENVIFYRNNYRPSFLCFKGEIIPDGQRKNFTGFSFGRLGDFIEKEFYENTENSLHLCC